MWLLFVIAVFTEAGIDPTLPVATMIVWPRHVVVLSPPGGLWVRQHERRGCLWREPLRCSEYSNTEAAKRRLEDAVSTAVYDVSLTTVDIKSLLT